jgi:Tfp pilus assembly protein FimT
MGNQQLLILAIGVVVLAIAVAVGITWFQDQAASSNRDELAMDMSQFAVRAQAYYRRPRTLAGGEGSFGALRMDKLTSQARNLNGSYTIETDPVPAAAQNIKLIGTGTECLADGRPVKVVMMVYPDSILNVGAEGH